MPVITLYAGAFCGGEALAKGAAEALGYELIDDKAIIERASARFKMPSDRLRKALDGRLSVFGRFTHDRERSLAFFTAALGELLRREGLVFLGRAGDLIPPAVSHALKVCVIADKRYRVRRAVEEEGLTEAQAAKRVRSDDELRSDWTEFVLHGSAFNPSTYDIVIPSDKVSPERALKLILSNSGKQVVQPTEASIQAVRDFELAARVRVALVRQGHDVLISAEGGRVTLTIDHHVIMLARLEGELQQLARGVEGVTSVETKIGPNFYQPDIYRKQSFETPTKVLLVDDEREFVQSLSERLAVRDVESSIAVSGEEALAAVEEQEPEVMVLDLKMPGIDGIEVLRRVKREHPDVEVIVLTGHGSGADEETCLELGASAYLRKPVDIEALSDAMKEAYRKIGERRAAKAGEEE